MFYVYFLQSLINNDIYIGSCADIKIRFALHNSGRVKSTKGYIPWKLLECEEYPTRSIAVRKEKFYKTAKQRKFLKQRFANKFGAVAKW